MDIKELAEQAGINFGGHPMNPLSVYFSELKRFAELVAAAERESCARLVEEVGRQTAAAIRARGDKHD